jgi:hypothetical protein
MTPSTRILGALAASSALALSAPGVAGAAPPGSLTFEQTFPLASRLCAKVAAGTENKHLKANAAAATADCTTLQSTFTTAHSTVLATRAAILPTLAADRAALKAACPTPKDVKAICRKAHKADDAAIVSLLHQLRAARHSYYRSIESARKQFWAEIKSLRGEKHIKADKPIQVPSV